MNWMAGFAFLLGLILGAVAVLVWCVHLSLAAKEKENK
jgi:hypothetical protein